MSERTPSPPKAPRPRDIASNPIIVGSIIVLTAIIGVIVSYSANRGLPFVPKYEIEVEVPDAAQLIEGGSEVRVGGARAGLVKEIEATRAPGDRPAFARLTLSLEKKLQEIPADSEVKVRPRSILGAKYLDLVLGDSDRTIAAGGRLPLSQAEPVVELDEAFNVFDEETTRGLQDTVIGLGDGFAGRGSALNETVTSAGRIIAPAQRVLRTLAAPRTDLAGLIDGAARATRALAPVAPELGSMLARGADTLRAVEAAGTELEQTLEQLPPTEIVGTRALRRIAPVLGDASALSRALRPAGEVLAPRARDIATALRTATPVLRRVPELSVPLTGTLRSLRRLSADPASSGAVRQLIATLDTLAPTLAELNPAQVECNVGGRWARNLASVFSDGDAAGPWLNSSVVLEPSQILQSGTQAPNLHANPYPIENAQQCEAGNEPYDPGRRIGNPGGDQKGAELTAPPAGMGG